MCTIRPPENLLLGQREKDPFKEERKMVTQCLHDSADQFANQKRKGKTKKKRKKENRKKERKKERKKKDGDKTLA